MNVLGRDMYLDSHRSSVNPELGGRKGASRRISVNSMHKVEIVAEFADRLAYAKIDIEGMDTVALTQLFSAGIQPAYVSVENALYEQFEQLVAAGYEGAQFVNQSKVESQQIPGPAAP